MTRKDRVQISNIHIVYSSEWTTQDPFTHEMVPYANAENHSIQLDSLPEDIQKRLINIIQNAEAHRHRVTYFDKLNKPRFDPHARRR